MHLTTDALQYLLVSLCYLWFDAAEPAGVSRAGHHQRDHVEGNPSYDVGHVDLRRRKQRGVSHFRAVRQSRQLFGNCPRQRSTVFADARVRILATAGVDSVRSRRQRVRGWANAKSAPGSSSRNAKDPYSTIAAAAYLVDKMG